MSESIATLFSGGEGVGVGARAAGLEHIWGIEVDGDIAAVARSNGFNNVMTADVTQVDPAGFEVPTVLHVSPPCPSFSTANHKRGETERDLALAKATVRFIEALRPPVVTLENVYLYRRSESFRAILRSLHNDGYRFDYWHINAADYGVPQTRKRLLLVAARGFAPQMPPATHAAFDDITPMFDPRRPWVGWYEAIADLVPDLPDSEFATWQKDRLPVKAIAAQPAGGLRAILVDSAGWVDDRGRRVPVTRDSDVPANTIVGNHDRRPMRAFVMSTRAFIVTGQTKWGCDELQVRGSQAPVTTVPLVKGDWRAQVAGRVVQMTPRALARFQTFPDSYTLPASKRLACCVIGNAVPPLLYQCISNHICRLGGKNV